MIRTFDEIDSIEELEFNSFSFITRDMLKPFSIWDDIPDNLFLEEGEY